MNDRELEKLIRDDIKRIMDSTSWGGDVVPPQPFEFRTRYVDLEMWVHENTFGEKAHPSCHRVNLCHSCGAKILYQRPYSYGAPDVNYARCSNVWCTASQFERTIEDLLNMQPGEIAKEFITQETLLDDDIYWPQALVEVQDASGAYLATRPMPREELVRRRVERFWAARREFRQFLKEEGLK